MRPLRLALIVAFAAGYCACAQSVDSSEAHRPPDAAPDKRGTAADLAARAGPPLGTVVRGSSIDQTKTGQNSEPLPVHKENVIVTGEWQPIALEEADRSVNQYELRNPALLFGSLVDAFDLDSSVYVSSRGANGIQADFSVRGGSFGQTLLLLNGIRLNDVQSAHYNSDFPVPLDAVDHIEVLRGSGSTLYGSDAVSGVINIITRPLIASDPVEVRVRGGIGNFGVNEQSGFIALHTGPLSERLAVERGFSTGFIDDRDYRNLAVSSDSWLKARTGLTRIFLGLDDRPFGANQFYGPYNSWERTKAWVADLTQDLGDRTTISLAYRRHTDLFELFRTDPAFYTNRHEDYLWDSTVRRHDPVMRSAQVFYGAEFLSDHVASNNLGVHSRQQGAIYAAFDVRALHRASLSMGTREEFYSGSGKVFSPNVSGGYWLASKWKIRGSASRAFRLPNYTDLYYHDPANLGNPNLKPERAWNYEGGLDWYPREHWHVSATVFERRERDDIDYVRANVNSVWQATNFDRLNFTGFEGAAAFTFPYSQKVEVQFTSIHGAEDALGILQSKYVFNYPTQEAVLSWQRMSASGWVARFRSGVANQYQRDSYLVLDASAAWTRSRFHPYVRATNLTGAGYQPVYGVLMPGRAAVVGLEICAVCRGK